jgi:dTDP-4-dehydrorhamnose 3,5-epimerase
VIFTGTALGGVMIVEPERREDDRGFFARTFDQKEFDAQGLRSRFVQCNISYNAGRGTLRGMHYQRSPHAEARLVSCVRGALYDAVIDLRPESPTYCRWCGVELTASNYKMLYVPEGCAHGFQTLADDTVVFYQMSEFYDPECAQGVRWDDPAFGIVWPLRPRLVSARDRSFATFAAAARGAPGRSR